jgi:hypothetical protein
MTRFIMGGQAFKGVLVDSTAVVVDAKMLPVPCTVWTVPVSGDTITVSYSLDGGVTYTTWPNGAVTAASNDVLYSGVTHLKFQQTAGSGTTSTYGAC